MSRSSAWLLPASLAIKKDDRPQGVDDAKPDQRRDDRRLEFCEHHPPPSRASYASSRPAGSRPIQIGQQFLPAGDSGEVAFLVHAQSENPSAISSPLTRSRRAVKSRRYAFMLQASFVPQARMLPPSMSTGQSDGGGLGPPPLPTGLPLRGTPCATTTGPCRCSRLRRHPVEAPPVVADGEFLD